MKVTQEQIEQKVVDLLTVGRPNWKPQYILMDPRTYKDFTAQFTPKERIKLNNSINSTMDKISKITKIQVTGDVGLVILEVNVEEDMFEVV